jgi:type II secretory pathway pseudopilin PulG
MSTHSPATAADRPAAAEEFLKMTRRPGITLTEVLVALFIMAIGTLAILTLFPAGLITMGQALKDDRAAQCANQANAYMRWHWKEYVVGPRTEPYFLAMNNPGGSGIIQVPTGSPTPSYPVYIDPIGAFNTAASTQWLGDAGQGNGTNQTNIPRRSLNLINSDLLALRTCSLLDSFGYDPNGVPQAGADMRSLQYMWGWLVQRKDNREQAVVDLHVIVYDRRVHLFPPATPETTYVPQAAAADQTVVVFPATGAPPVQKGGWLLDATSTTIDPNTTPPTHYVPPDSPTIPTPLPPNYINPGPGVRNGNFYRVVSVTQNQTTGNVEVELQTPLKQDSGDARGLQPQHRRFVHLAGVYEVFDLPPLTAAE